VFKNILVPLDGSKLSEASLAPAALLAKTFHAQVTLLHIIEQDAPAEVHKDRHLTQPAEAETYLKDIAQRAFPGTKVETHVHSAPAADVIGSIIEHISEFKPDLIITCTHGHGGMRDVLYGSIAQQIVSQGTTPLLIIKPDSTRRIALDRILVPLDPDSGHDDSLPLARSFATAFGAKLHLLSIIPTFSTLSGEQAAAGNLMPATVQAMLDIKEENASEDLNMHANEFRKDGIKTFTEVARGDPARGIVKIADISGADLIILTTHRRAGMGAFWARSVAPKVAQKTKIPLLLMPLSKNE
jgi:nucleotide-binding universal stress UspA family protein